jgi:hypothetical protein
MPPHLSVQDVVAIVVIVVAVVILRRVAILYAQTRRR